MAEIKHLLETYELGSLTLKNRAVMAPMTRSRAIGNVPNALMAEYYGQRATNAGLIITEGTAPSPNGLGYARIPGLFSDEQVAGWKLVTDAVHAEGSRIFAQLMHVGRVGHPNNLPDGAELIAPSALACPGEMYTDEEGPQAHPEPRAMTEDDIEATIEEYVHASKKAIEAGFDGVELHGANGYLIEQFLNPATNQRDDAWGGSGDARNRFALEVARRVADAIGAEHTGIRISPYGVFNGMQHDFEGVSEQFTALAKALGELELVYLHLVDHGAMGAPSPPAELKAQLREAFPNTFVLSGGYDGERAEQELAENKGDIVAFGRPFLANPDLIDRYVAGAEVNAPNFETFYTPGPEGYTDYPTKD